MQARVIILLALLASLVGSARADRPLTQEERAKLLSALAAEGCAGGKLEFDDGKYEVDDAKCHDGRTYDLKFDRDFRLVRKELEDDLRRRRNR
jgi:hypothetical protein